MDGCFDLMHFGHFNAIRQVGPSFLPSLLSFLASLTFSVQARELGDILVAGIHSDEEIEQNKGPPVMKFAERLEVLQSCKWVDEVVTGVPYNVSAYMDNIINKHNCDFIVHGDDPSLNADGTDAYAAIKAAGRFRMIKRTEGISTTELVGRMLLVTKTHHDPEDSGPHSPTGSGSADGSGPIAMQSAFLATSRRINQFSNNLTPAVHDKVVYVNGVWDLFHVGHVRFLKRARALGTFLIVGIFSDKEANCHMGSNFPIMNIHERVLSVLACKYVDEVIIGAPYQVSEGLLKDLNVSVVVKKPLCDLYYQHEDTEKEEYKVPRDKGILQEVESRDLLEDEDAETAIVNTGTILQRIIDHRLKYTHRNARRAAKITDYEEKKSYVQEL